MTAISGLPAMKPNYFKFEGCNPLVWVFAGVANFFIWLCTAEK